MPFQIILYWKTVSTLQWNQNKKTPTVTSIQFLNK